MIRTTLRLSFALGLLVLVGCGAPTDEPVVEDVPPAGGDAMPGMPGDEAAPAMPGDEAAPAEGDIPPAEPAPVIEAPADAPADAPAETPAP